MVVQDQTKLQAVSRTVPTERDQEQRVASELAVSPLRGQE